VIIELICVLIYFPHVILTYDANNLKIYGIIVVDVEHVRM